MASKASENDKDSVCVLTSGGVDSAVLLCEMAKSYRKVVPLFIRNGHLWEETELYWLGRFLKATAHPAVGPLQVLVLPMEDVYHTHWSMTGREIPDFASTWADVYLPGRNLILLSKTAVYCALNDIHAVALGPLKTNQFADSSSAFFRGLQKVVELGLSTRLEILTPFADRDKHEILGMGRDLPLELTFSCLNPVERRHCGACNKCAERIEAFAEAGIPDRTAYQDRDFAVKRADGN
jgi:7-cyano-7-deazaguanine synthase